MLKYGLKSNILHFKNTQRAERTARRPDPGRPSGTDKDILSQIHDAAEFPAGPAVINAVIRSVFFIMMQSRENHVKICWNMSMVPEGSMAIRNV